MQDAKLFQSVISPKGDKNPDNSESDTQCRQEKPAGSDKARYGNKWQSPMVILYLANRVAPFGKKVPTFIQ